MDRIVATTEIRKIFATYKNFTAKDDALIRILKDGKLYELYCLAFVLEELKKKYGYDIRFCGSNIEFQSSPGMVDKNKAHFEILDETGQVKFELYTDVEFMTLSSRLGNDDRSSYHEIDILIINVDVTNRTRPSVEDIVLGVECKAHSVVRKSTIKEILGIRRELGLFRGMQRTRLSLNSPKGFIAQVPCEPSSEYWLLHLNSDINSYKTGPNAFGIQVLWLPCT